MYFRTDQILSIMRLAFLIAVLFTLANQLIAGSDGKSISARRTDTAPKIDGILDDDAWKVAPVARDFVQFDPVEGAPPSDLTEVRILYDDGELYFGVFCYDAHPESLITQLTRRDRTTQADRFSVIIDSYHDHNTAFLFSGSVSGVQTDGVLSQDGRLYDVQWDAVWEFNAKSVSDGWTAEFRIPFNALRFSDNDEGYVWGLNFRRYHARKKETDEWVMVPRKEAPPGTISSVSLMGHLTGLTDIHPPLRLEVVPYQVSRLSYFAQPSPFPLQRLLEGSAGVDVKYGLANNFTFDAAVNPDFGQVEVDQAVLNLSVFETFYPEKRPFFLEGSQIFTFGSMFDSRQLRLFYSRRVGKKPGSRVAPSNGYFFSELPQFTTILGAGKITGRTDNGLSVGVLSAVTERESAVEEDASGNIRRDVHLEPTADYTAFRIKKEVLSNSFVGMIGTLHAADRSLPSMTGGMDWNMRSSDGSYAMDGYIAGSRTPSGNDDWRTGTAGRIGIGRLAHDHWLAFSLYDFATRTFDIHDAGFFNSPPEHGGYTQITFKEDKVHGPFRRMHVSFEGDYRWNWDGARTLGRLEVEPGMEFLNFWTLGLDYIRELKAFDDEYRGIRGLYERAEGNRLTATLTSDPRRKIQLAMHSGYNNNVRGMSSFFAAAQLTIRPNSWMEYAPALTVIRTRNDEAWTFLSSSDAGYSIFADRDVDQYDFSLRGTITFTRDVSVQFFTQTLIAKGQYLNFKELVSPTDLRPYGYDKSSINPDFNSKAINANLVLRWEYLPGSTLYVVWTQAREGYTQVYDTPLRTDINEALRLPMDNIILAKINYRWSL